MHIQKQNKEYKRFIFIKASTLDKDRLSKHFSANPIVYTRELNEQWDTHLHGDITLKYKASQQLSERFETEQEILISS